ncbi:hypothetical protein AU374_05887 [Cupriavidus metallidurans]|jgi:hypothetical protein|nr:hypothetical protein C3Z06_32275 [Cupriavidus metallidurans]KWW32287.1 hypothetical protein AU374_05887 [Cupriavidus metallidurans]
MQVEKQIQEADGSAWTALVRVQGVLYVASYVANRLSVRLGPYKHAPRRPRWAEEHVKRWAEQQIALLPSDWISKHQEMYG